MSARNLSSEQYDELRSELNEIRLAVERVQLHLDSQNETISQRPTFPETLKTVREELSRLPTAPQIITIVIVIVGLATGGLGLTISSLDRRVDGFQENFELLVRVDERLKAFEMDIDDIQDGQQANAEKLESIEAAVNALTFLGAANSSAVTLWVSLDPANSPFSEYLAVDNTWTGVFPEVMSTIERDLEVAEVRFLSREATRDDSSSYTESGTFGYVVRILSEEDPAVDPLLNEGWRPIFFDPFFEPAGCEPLGYRLLIPPDLRRVKFEENAELALDQVPLAFWQGLAQQIDACPVP